MEALKGLALAALLACAAPAGADPVDCWRSLIAEASARFGVPAEWIGRVMRAESHGKAMIARKPVVSRAGAIGLMQLMPGTWRDMRLSLGLGSDASDPHDNIMAGAAYLRFMYDRFGYPGLFAAYNAGPARYSAYVAGVRTLPAETRYYVARLVRSAPMPAVAAVRSAARARVFAVKSHEAVPPETDPDGARGAGPLFVTLSRS